MGRRAESLVLSVDERLELERLVRVHSTSQQRAGRARMILLLSSGLGILEVSQMLCVWRKTVSTWRKRWLLGPTQTVIERLSDEPRAGAPARITPQQVCAIIALACESPSNLDLPLSHWSASDLAREAVKRGLVDRISPRQAGRFLKRI
ncbi:MAG: helix-turn-helix domain-containing protein [Magnetovibrio sp.]|nr:helix-turn-helix domain-containing protein [Magnetovibrio sp.]